MRPLPASLLVSCLATSTQRRRGSAASPASSAPAAVPGLAPRGVEAGEGRKALRAGADEAVGEQATATGLRGRARGGVGPSRSPAAGRCGGGGRRHSGVQRGRVGGNAWQQSERVLCLHRMTYMHAIAHAWRAAGEGGVAPAAV